MPEDYVDELLEKLYKDYGTDTGYLFGISPTSRPAVKAIIQFVIDDLEAEK